MNALVSQYTRPQFENEALPEEESQELISTANPLSLKFALPPVAQVRFLNTVAMYSYCGRD
jgi:hypothetical protein